MSASASDISVVVPLHNGERYVAETLRSILDQTLRPAEVIVVDDGSTDAGATIVRDFGPPVRYLFQEHLGQAAAINHGLREARGSLIASLDADDLWTRDKLELQVAAIEGDPSLDLVFGLVEPFYSPELGERERASITAAMGKLKGYFRGAMLARRESIQRVGPFDTQWKLVSFIDWQARATEAGLRMAVLPQVVVRRRLHTANNSMLAADSRGDYARVVRAALDRRRAQARGA